MSQQVQFTYLTQAQYDNLKSRSPGQLYFTSDTKRMYKGDVVYAEEEIRLNQFSLPDECFPITYTYGNADFTINDNGGLVFNEGADIEVQPVDGGYILFQFSTQNMAFSASGSGIGQLQFNGVSPETGVSPKLSSDVSVIAHNVDVAHVHARRFVKLSSICDEFSSTVQYLGGEYVWKDGKLYRASTNHTGNWNASHFTGPVTVGEILSDLQALMGSVEQILHTINNGSES